MRVLVWPQLSMRSYSTGLWHLEMDPNLNKDRAWARAVPQWDWEWLLPPPAQWSPESSKGLAPGVKFSTMPWAPNVQAGRYNFPYEAVRTHLIRIAPDAMILEVPEHAPAIRTIQQAEGLDFPVFSYVNYAPVLNYTKGDTFGRQVEGAACSERLVFNTQGLMDVWTSMAKRVHWPGVDNVTLWPGVYSPEEIDRQDASYSDPPAVFFTSRLSDPAKNRHPQFFEALRRVYRTHGFQTWIGDPNRVVPEKSLRDWAPNVTRMHCTSREQYLSWMRQAAVVPCLWEQDKIYSIGFCDALASGSIAIVSASTPDMPGVTVGPEPDERELERALVEAFGIWADQSDLQELLVAQRRWLMKERSVEENVGVMVSEVEALVR